MWSATSISRIPSSSRPSGDTASSSSADALIPDDAAAASSALTICLLTLRLVTFALSRPSPAMAAVVPRDPSAAAAVFARRSSRAMLLPVPDVPKWSAIVVSRSSGHASSRDAAAQMAPRRMMTFGSVSAGPLDS